MISLHYSLLTTLRPQFLYSIQHCETERPFHCLCLFIAKVCIKKLFTKFLIRFLKKNFKNQVAHLYEFCLKPV